MAILSGVIELKLGAVGGSAGRWLVVRKMRGAPMALGVILGRADASPARRLWGASASGTILVTAVAVFGYFYPLYTGQSIPYADWANHMWLPSWM